MQRDRKTGHGGWVGMTCVGNFVGGELHLPDFEMSLRFLPGDVVFLREGIRCLIVPVTGDRRSLLFFSSSSAKDAGARSANLQFAVPARRSKPVKQISEKSVNEENTNGEELYGDTVFVGNLALTKI